MKKNPFSENNTPPDARGNNGSGGLFRAPERLFPPKVGRPHAQPADSSAGSNIISIPPFAWVAAFFFLVMGAVFYPVLRHPHLAFASSDTPYFFALKHYWIESFKAGDPAFWNPCLLLGVPFAANQQAGTLTPFNFFHFFLPYPSAFTLRYLLHFILGLFGTYFFMRRLNFERLGSTLAALSYCFCGFMIIHMSWGHQSLVESALWLPVILYFLHRALEEKRLWLLALSTACLSLCFLESFPQMTLYFFLTAGFYLVYCRIRGMVSWGQAVFAGAFMLAGFTLLSACQLFPSLELMPRCTRSGWSFEGTVDGCLFPSHFLYFAQPAWLRPQEINEIFANGHWREFFRINYVGVAPLVLFLGGVAVRRLEGHYVFFLFLALFFSLLSLGDSTAFSKWFYRLFYDYVPFFKTTRQPDRMMAVASFAMACGAGWAASAIRSSLSRRPFWVRRTVTALLCLLLAATAWDLWKWGKIILPINDLDIYCSSPPFPPEVWKRVQADDYPRISPEGENDVNLFYRVSQTHTTDRLFLKDLHFLFWANFINHPAADLVGLKYSRPFISPLAPKWKVIIPENYFNEKAFPRAFLAGGFLPSEWDVDKTMNLINSGSVDLRAVVLLDENPAFSFTPEPGIAGEAKITRYRNNRVEISLDAVRPCFLVLSDSYYPGWKAWVDGKPAAVVRADGALRAVPIPQAGRHRVVMDYRPLPLYAGLAVSIVSWLLLVALLFKGRGLSLFFSRQAAPPPREDLQQKNTPTSTTPSSVLRPLRALRFSKGKTPSRQEKLEG